MPRGTTGKVQCNGVSFESEVTLKAVGFLQAERTGDDP